MSTELDITTADELERDLHERRNGDGAAPPMVVAGRPRRRWPWLIAGLAVGAGGVLVAEPLLNDDGADEVVLDETTVLTTAAVQIADLVEEVEWDGELAAGETLDVTFRSPSTGTTSGTSTGTTSGATDASDVRHVDRHDVRCY